MQARPADKANYIRFLKIFREEIDAEAAANPGRTKLLLTAAVGVGKYTVETAYDIPGMNKYLDWIGLMTYDLHGSWEDRTGLNAGLYSTTEDIAHYGYDHSVSSATDYWISHGADPKKLLLGLATYGRGFTLANAGLNQGPLSAVSGPSVSGPQSKEPGYIAYHEIVDMIANGATTYYDEARQAPYLIKGDQWIGYDNQRSLQAKMDFLKSKGLRGSMVWAIELDDIRGQQYPLLNTIKDALAGYRVSDTTSGPKSSTSQIAADCVNVKSDSECENANRIWNMCTTGGAWWKNQCKKECSLC
jgi:chitinase